jgi:predicted transcriptional regulator of viral defense system
MNKHISYRSSELLSSLNNGEKQFFTINDAINFLPSSSYSTIRKLLSEMAIRGLILRISKGLYKVIPYEKNSEEYFPNWHLVAEAIVQSNLYYIGFYTALDIHGLITQPSLVEQIVTENQIVPKYRVIKNVKFEFITLKENRFFGYEKTWIDDFNKIYCSDLEKTLIDCLYKPNSANGITEIIKAIYESRGKLNISKMSEYLKKFDAQVVYKRLGFLLQHLDLFQELRKEIQSKLTGSYTLLDPSLPKNGKHHSQWSIIDNTGIDSSLKSILT